MGRRKITEEANSQTQSADEDDADTTERQQLTQRMPEGLLADVDALADELGMSRNAAINMLVKQGLKGF